MPAPSSSLSRHLSQHQPVNGGRYSPASFNPLKRSRTPLNEERRELSAVSSNGADKETSAGDERRKALFKTLYTKSEGFLAGLFSRDSEAKVVELGDLQSGERTQPQDIPTINEPPVAKRKARAIDEDDYGDEDDEEEDGAEPPEISSPLRAKVVGTNLINSIRTTPLGSQTAQKPADEQAKSTEEARKQLEEEKKAAENAAKESSQTMFYTLENDRDAMLEQQKLDELDRQMEAEASANNAGGPNGASQQGSLSSANLGASSLTLKYLIRRIDAKRNMVQASDQQLRMLMSEVRKNRSKWASEEKIGQEELYEAAERVLMELKAKTEWSTPFLQKVNKRDAPDYYAIIKHPMDLGTITKKLKNLQYQSKKEFVDDLDSIWTNCLRYNTNPEHFLRKKAEHMKKESARYIPLIPDVVIKSRAEVEAEERRLQTDFDDAEDSDEEPLRTARGRKAPGKSSKKGTSTARKTSTADEEGTPGPETRTQPNGIITNLKHEHLRDADSSSQAGFATPPPRLGTPFGINGIMGSAAAGSQGDFSEIEAMDTTMNGLGQTEDPDQEDEDYKTWKQVTKKDRAQVAAERHRLFKNDRLALEEPALLRTRAGMRRWLKLQTTSNTRDDNTQETTNTKTAEQQSQASAEGTTLSEDIAEAEDYHLPDYYDPLAGVPQLEDRLIWKEDSEGQVIDQREECLRMVPSGLFTAPRTGFAGKVEKNLRQMQDTRKIVAKIAVVKQMQLQTQTYQNQFQKYDPEPFIENDIPPMVVSDDGPIMTPWVCRAALQRSVGKLFYHAGFEEFQPSALETMTDIVGKYFCDLVSTISTYTEAPKVPAIVSGMQSVPATIKPNVVKTSIPPLADSANVPLRGLKPRFSREAAILHTLRESGHDLESLEAYAKDDIDRLSTKLETHHVRTRDYLADLLRPALDPATAGADGAGVFQEGSEQFVGGDFAEDIGEDYFGFKELGLDKEFGIAGFSVPLHLLQSRMASVYQPASAIATTTMGQVMPNPEPWEPLTSETLDSQIGLVRDFFREKLERLGDSNAPLMEDEDLPPKQRFPRPRLPPTGKISSPRKRPIREQQMMARKKRRLEIEAEREREAAAANAANGVVNDAPAVDAPVTTVPVADLASSTVEQQTKPDNPEDAPVVNGEPNAMPSDSVDPLNVTADAEGDKDNVIAPSTSFPPAMIDSIEGEESLLSSYPLDADGDGEADADADGDADGDAGDSTPLANRKDITLKPLNSKIKLEIPAGTDDVKVGDPSKQPQPPPAKTGGGGSSADKSGAGTGGGNGAANGSGNDMNDENAASGILSPESVAIAAH